MNKYKRIFIIGHSGAGKGVLAQAVAKQLGWKFINADVLGCVACTGRRVSEILGKDGERCFNQSLHQILQHQITQEDIVVTTDESIVCDQTTRQLLKSEFTVYLQVSEKNQSERLSGGYRPLLPVADYDALLSALHQERNDLYNDVASFTLSSDNGNIEEHANSIIQALAVTETTDQAGSS